MFSNAMKNDVVSGLLKIFGENIQQIILYGSVARNEEQEDSDIDIAIILNGAFTSESKKSFLTWAADLDMKYERVFSIIDIEKENLDKWGKVLPFYRNVFDEGVVLWKAA